jgi:UDP-glucose 4-epimerase
MNWLVTGGCGFLGTAFIKSLLEEGGHGVRVVDNLTVGTREDLGTVCDFVENGEDEIYPVPPDGPVELVAGDIRDGGLAVKAAAGADAIVHLAANTGVAPSVEDPRADCESNVIGVFNYLEAARCNGVGRFVLASSGAAVGEVEPPIHEEMPPHPVSPYGASKMAGECYCSAYYRTFGVEAVALRFSNVYGPGSTHKNSVVAKFVKRARGGEVLEIYGSGDQSRDFIYIDDLVDAMRLAATVPGIGGEVFQIATGAETTVSEVTDMLLPILAEAGIKDVEMQNTSPRTGDVVRNYADTSKARRMLGWEARMGLNEGLGRTVNWFLG